MKYDLVRLRRFIFPWFFSNPDGSDDPTFNSDYVDLLVTGLDNINDQTKTYEDLTASNIGYSNQLQSLEDELNDRYDPIGREIFIDTNNFSTTTFLFNRSEGISDALKTYVYNRSETIPNDQKVYSFNRNEIISGSNTFNYTVNVPFAIYAMNDLLIINTIERVNAFSITYHIITF